MNSLKLNPAQIRDLAYICEAAACELSRRNDTTWWNRAIKYGLLFQREIDQIEEEKAESGGDLQ
jgi:hypothetical protein